MRKDFYLRLDASVTKKLDQDNVQQKEILFSCIQFSIEQLEMN